MRRFPKLSDIVSAILPRRRIIMCEIEAKKRSKSKRPRRCDIDSISEIEKIVVRHTVFVLYSCDNIYMFYNKMCDSIVRES